MTAEIAILNTYGVSLAADSAVTVSVGEGEKKIYNSANKVFSLSKYRPVGIMVFSSAKFMEIEWEIIIKEYRKKLGKDKYNTLFEYADNFFDYLKSAEFISEEQKDKYLLGVLGAIINRINNLFLKNVKTVIEKEKSIKRTEIQDILEKTISKIEETQKSMEDNKDYTVDIGYLKSKEQIIKEGIKVIFENIKLDKDKLKRIENIIYVELQKSISYLSYSGIVIAGYGEKEIFPSLFSCQVYGNIGNSIMVNRIEKNAISCNQKAIISPFAQSEMVSSFMEGVDPYFERTILKEISILFENITKISKIKYVRTLQQIKKKFEESISELKQKVYVEPIINIVASLQKSDLAEMAEALVNLTSFKRHVSAEAETVGGPTDVAVITKGDGFIWIKRKHYFKPELNMHFFENYFKEDCDD